jgi:uncharacterized integral membrane protein
VKISHPTPSVYDDRDRAQTQQRPPSVDDLGAKHLRDTMAPGDHYPRSAGPPLRTRAGMAWVAVGTATLIAVVFLAFVAQNTQSVHVSFLWLDGDTSLAVAALVAAVGGAVTTLVFGTARILQLRRAVKHPTRAAPTPALRTEPPTARPGTSATQDPGRVAVTRAGAPKLSSRKYGHASPLDQKGPIK